VSHPRRFITPPGSPVRSALAVPSHSSDSIGAAHPSNWTAWDDPSLSQDIDGVNLNDPSSGTDLTQSGSSTSDPWTVDVQDIQDSIDARAEQLKDSGESAT
jgi:hypothetical protein